jgi:hypothetical protein
MRVGLVGLLRYASCLALLSESPGAEPTPGIELSPPVAAEVVELAPSGGMVIVLHDAMGRRLRFSFESRGQVLTHAGEQNPEAHILIGGEDPAAPPNVPLPIWGEAEASLLETAFPALSEAAEARDSLKAHIAWGEAHGDTIEVLARNPNADVVYVAKRAVRSRLQMIEAARRGNVGVDEYALRFFSLTPPLRVRELRWHRSGQQWTLVAEDSANRTVQLCLPKHPGQPSARWAGTSKLEYAEGAWEDRMLLLAAQLALRSCADTDRSSGQCSDAMRALRARMERILQVLRRD